MQLETLQDRPPFVSFEYRAEEDRNATVEAGRFISKDVAYVFVTPAGSKDRLESKAEEWLQRQAEQAAQGRLPEQWLTHYKRLFEAFKLGQEVPVDGTSIRNWPLLSPAQARQLSELHVRTVEELAVANEELILRLGMGGRALKAKAVEWCKTGGSDKAKQTEEVVALRQKVQDQANAIEVLTAQVASLQKETK